MAGAVAIPEADAPHISRDAPGHVPDTAESRALLIETASDPACLLGEDRLGSRWYARVLPDGRPVWAVRRGDLIRNGGVNATARRLPPEGLTKRETGR